MITKNILPITRDAYLREVQQNAAQIYWAARAAYAFPILEGEPEQCVRFQRAAARSSRNLRIQLGIED